jgi:hypothetical protein
MDDSQYLRILVGSMSWRLEMPSGEEGNFIKYLSEDTQRAFSGGQNYTNKEIVQPFCMQSH